MTHRKTIPGNKGITFAFALATLLLAGCISRDNPWDPINYRGKTLADCDIIDAARRADSLNAQVNSTYDTLIALRQSVDSLQMRNTLDSNAFAVSVLRPNNLTLERNRGVAERNDSIAIVNASLPLEQALVKQYQDTLIAVPAFRPSGAYLAQISATRLLATTAQSLLLSGALLCDPDSPFDTLRAAAVYDSITALLAILEARSQMLVHYVSTINDSLAPAVAAINVSVRAYNDSVRAYNDRLSFAVVFASHPVVSNADTLAARMLAALPGDTIVLAGDTLSGAFQFPQRGLLPQSILVTGQPDRSTVLANGSLLLDNIGSVKFQYITFCNNASAGVKLVNASSPIRFSDCIFTGNAGDGLEISDCDVYLSNCRITGNRGNGVQTNASLQTTRLLSLDNCLIAGNSISAIKTVGCALSIRNSTLADNAQHGINALNPQLDITLYGSIVAFNTGYGVFFNSIYESARSLVLLQLNFFGNTSGATNDLPPGSFTILTHDPAFADRLSGNYAIGSGPLHDLETQGVVIGYRP